MSVGETLLDAVCEQRDQLPLLIAVVVVMGLLVGFSLLYVEPGTASYVIAVVDAVIVVGSLALFGFTYWYCTKRAME